MLDLQKRSIQYNILKREVDTNRSLYDGLLQRYKEVDVAGGVGANNVFVVDRAMLRARRPRPTCRGRCCSRSPSVSAPVLRRRIGLERLDDTIRSPEEMRACHRSGDPRHHPQGRRSSTVETTPPIRARRCRKPTGRCARRCSSPPRAACRRSLLITSAGPSEGKSVTSLCDRPALRHPGPQGAAGRCRPAQSLAAQEARPRQRHRPQQLPDRSLHAAGGDAGDHHRQPGVHGVRSAAANAADLLGSPRLLSLLSIGLEVFDLIVIDGPPVMGLADAPLLSNSAAATVFVRRRRSGSSRRRARCVEAARTCAWRR